MAQCLSELSSTTRILLGLWTACLAIDGPERFCSFSVGHLAVPFYMSQGSAPQRS